MKKRVKQFITATLLILCVSLIMCSLTFVDASAELINEQILDDNENGFGNYYVETLPDGHTTMVSGNITIEKDASGATIPLKNVKVSLWDRDKYVNDFIATTYTDENGFYQFFFQDGHGIFENRDDLQVRVFASGETFNIFNPTNFDYYNSIDSFDFAFTYYEAKDFMDEVVPGTSTSGLDIEIKHEKTDKYKAFIISQFLVDVQKFVYDFADMTIDGKVYVLYPLAPEEFLGNVADSVENILSIVEELFPDFEADGLMNCLRSIKLDLVSFCYNRIMMLERDSFKNPLTCMHEYSHFIEWRRNTYGFFTKTRVDLQIKGHSGIEDSITKYENKSYGMELSWSEGWARALARQSLLYNNYYAEDGTPNDIGLGFTLENFDTVFDQLSFAPNNRGEAQEVNILTLLLTLYCPCPINETSSLLTLGYSEFFRTSAKSGITDMNKFVENLFSEYPNYRNIIGKRLGDFAIAPKDIKITESPKLHKPPTISFIGQGSKDNPNNIFRIMVFDDSDNLLWQSREISDSVLYCKNSYSNRNEWEFEYKLTLEEWEEILNAFSNAYSAMNFTVAGYVNTPESTLHKKTGPYISGYCKFETFAGVKIDNHIYYRENESNNETKTIFSGIDSYLRQSVSYFTVPASINGFDLIGIDDYAFEDCTSINNFTIPSNLSFIGDSAFKNTGYWNSHSEGVITLNNWVIGYKGSSPSNVVLPNNLIGIADGSFMNSALTSINLENIVFIGNNAFCGSKLKNVAIHSNTIRVGNKAFSNCANLTEVDFYAKNPPIIGNFVFDDCNSKLVLYVIADANENYKGYNALENYEKKIKNKQINVIYYNFDSTVYKTKSVVAFGIISENEYVTPTNRPGYSFDGWYDSQIDYTNKYSIGATLNSFDDISLYPKWTVINYSITYDCGGGTNSENPYTYTINDSISLLPASKEGYSFNGWFDTASQCIIDSITNCTENLNLTALWIANTYIVSLDINCDDGDINNNKATVIFDTICSLPIPTRANYVFDGWFDGVNSTSIQYSQAEGLLLMNDGCWCEPNNKKLYAHWTIKEFYVIVAEKVNDSWDFDKYWNGSSLSTEQQYVTALQIRSSFSQTMRAYFNSTDGLKPGHLFSYFYTSWDNDFGNWVNLTMPDLGENKSTIIVYPEWEKEKHSILYKVNGMSYRSFFDVEYESNISVESPSKVGYTFGGWYVEDLIGVFENTQYANRTLFQYTLMPDLTPFECSNGGTIIVTPTWIPKITTFNLIVNNNVYTSFNVTVGTQITNLTEINKTGYEFIGWYDNTSFSGNSYYNGLTWISDLPIINLYPKYDIITYQIIYNINSDVTCDGQSSYNVTSSVQLPTPVKRGYRFTGWKTQNNQIISSIPQGTTGKLILTPQWVGKEINAATVSYTTISYNNCLSDTIILDFTNCAVNVNKTFYIDSSINEITIKGSGRQFTNLSFVIKNRSNFLKFSLWNIGFSAKESEDAIRTENSFSEMLIYSYGTNNQITGGLNTTNDSSSYTCAIRIDTEKLIIEGEENSSLNVAGGKGKDGSTYGENGTNGGYGIVANIIKVRTCSLIVEGGNGGNGYKGSNGANGFNGAAPPSSGGGVEGAKGGDGTNGTNGSKGGNGGNGSYAIKCDSIKMCCCCCSCSIQCTSGNGGNGANGGSGGNGGNGANGRDGRFAIYSGDGGNGGSGGTGGNGGNGGNVSQAIDGNILTSTIKCYIGNVGRGGAGGAGGVGGTGGRGGKYYNQNKWRANGSNGSNGSAGTAGSYGIVK